MKTKSRHGVTQILKNGLIISVIVFGMMTIIATGGGSSDGTRSGSVTIVVDSFRQDPNEALYSSSSNFMPSFTNEPEYLPGYINSGPPEYLKVTLLTIYLENSNESVIVWEGQKEILLNGSKVDLTELNSELNEIPVGTYSDLKIEFSSIARIKGTLTETFDVGEGDEQLLTVYTNSAYPYYPNTHSGGASDYTAFTTGPSEEMDVGIGDYGNTVIIESDNHIEITEESDPIVTFLFDLNRMLRFYNGKHPDPNHGGVGPDDPTDVAYFFAHSVFAESIGVYLGDSGMIEGYQALYANYDGDIGVGTPVGVKAWMTLVFDSEDNFLSGHIIGDDDNALTVAKGIISQYAVNVDGSIDFSYELDHGTTVYSVTGFERQENILDRSPTALYDGYNQGGVYNFHGEAEFILNHIQ